MRFPFQQKAKSLLSMLKSYHKYITV